MIVSEAIVKEVNQYYANRGGKRVTTIHNFANFMQKAASRKTAEAKATEKMASESEAASSDKSEENARSQSQSGRSCCEQCRLTSQLMMQMFSRSLYCQGALGYSPVGTGAFSAYQNMLNLFGGSTGLS